MAYSAIIKLPFSTLGITSRDETLLAIEFLDSNTIAIVPQDPFAEEVIAQLEAYCADKNFCFDLPLSTSATIFQKCIRESLSAIPVGQVLSYGQLAARLGSGARAVAMACRHNPLPVIVPCHRIVAKNTMGGYAGAISGKPVEIKRWLLEHECASKF